MPEEEHRDADTDQPHQTHADEDPAGPHEAQQKGSTVTFRADRLQEKELITREIDPATRRAKIVRLAERGREVRQLIGTAMPTRSPIAHLSAAEQRQLGRLSTKAARAKSTGAATITGTD
ncbi:hypothetical protein [Nocardia brasiliensis]|uniref:hypothetical protein n=1 Tax=Nocardia brasiliensis TaxID=37326 RepID=UPI0024584542|nr:hypothetical protein [Nocardia brasiliensis]